jgi:hypothetical protein
MDEEGTEMCDCGVKRYGYYADAGFMFVCFKCGRFKCEGFSKEMEKFFKDEPAVILQLIQDGVFKSLNDINP